MTDRQALRDYAIKVSVSRGVDPGIFCAQINQESGWNPTAKSPAGAQGIAQFMPATAAGMGLVDPFEPFSSLDAAAQLDAANLARYHGDYPSMLAAYNAGPGAVDRYGGVPPYDETQHYVAVIMPALGSIAAPGAAAPAPAPAPIHAAPVGGVGAVFSAFAALPSWSALPTGQRIALLGAVAAGAAWLAFSD